jgi:hypothetical protein
MAGDWIKFEKTTPDKPEVFEIAGKLGIDPDAVVGKLLRVWSWFDSHTENGNAPVTVRPLLDRITGVTGLVQTLIDVGWIADDGIQMSVSNFSRHNGETAKNRALAKERVNKHRSKSNAKCNGASVTSPLPEKRREETITPNPLESQIGALLGRRPTTRWSKKEKAALKAIGPIEPEDMAMLERFYSANIAPDIDYRRTAIQTLLNNWNGEIDKARLYSLQNP